MTKAVRRIRAWLKTLSPRTRALIHGAGAGLSAYPVSTRRTFITDDAAALRADWRAVGADMQTAIRHTARHERDRIAAR